MLHIGEDDVNITSIQERKILDNTNSIIQLDINNTSLREKSLLIYITTCKLDARL